VKVYWYVTLVVAVAVVVSVLLVCLMATAAGLAIPALIVAGSLWWGIPQARHWWVTRDVHREMRREVRELTRRR